jgi:hypothetical protein
LNVRPSSDIRREDETGQNVVVAEVPVFVAFKGISVFVYMAVVYKDKSLVVSQLLWSARFIRFTTKSPRTFRSSDEARMDCESSL